MNPMQDSYRTRERPGAEIFEPAPLAGATLGEHRHVYAFFHSANGEYRVILPFIKEGSQA